MQSTINKKMTDKKPHLSCMKGIDVFIISYLAGFNGCSAPAILTNWGVQWPPGKIGSNHSRTETVRGFFRAAALADPISFAFSILL